MKPDGILDLEVVARLLAVGAAAMVAFALVLVVGLAGAGSPLEWALGGAMVMAAGAAAVACFRAAEHLYHLDEISGGRPRRLVPVRVKR